MKVVIQNHIQTWCFMKLHHYFISSFAKKNDEIHEFFLSGSSSPPFHPRISVCPPLPGDFRCGAGEHSRAPPVCRTEDGRPRPVHQKRLRTVAQLGWKADLRCGRFQGGGRLCRWFPVVVGWLSPRKPQFVTKLSTCGLQMEGKMQMHLWSFLHSFSKYFVSAIVFHALWTSRRKIKAEGCVMETRLWCPARKHRCSQCAFGRASWVGCISPRLWWLLLSISIACTKTLHFLSGILSFWM